MAAVINLVTRKDAKGLNVVLQGGGLGTHQERISWSTRQGNNRLQIQAQNYATDGFSSAKIAQGGAEADGFKQQSWGLKWGRDMGKMGNLDFSYSSQLYQGNLDNGPFVDDRDFTSKASSHSFRAQYEVKNWTVRAFQDLIHREFKNDSTNVAANAFSTFSLSNYVGLNQGFESFVKILVKENATLLIGSEFRRQKTDQSDLSISEYGPYISPDLTEKQKTQQILGTYFTFQQSWGKFGYEVGTRWNSQSTFGNYFTYNFNPGANQCANPASVQLTVQPQVEPVFTHPTTLCQNDPFMLPVTAQNGITGTWNPQVNSQQVGSIAVTFTPDAGQCSNSVNQTIVVNATPTNAITQTGITLSSVATGVTYQWIDCNTNQPVLGATNQSFTTTEPVGTYAVIVTANGCSDTSTCISVDQSGLSEGDFNIGLIPNPANESVLIQWDTEAIQVIELLDEAGKIVRRGYLKGAVQQVEFSLAQIAAGVYYVRLIGANNVAIEKLIKL
jgi:hypothetical protein